MKKKMNLAFKAAVMMTICVLTLGLSSCSKDNEYTPDREIATNIVGTWEIEQYDTGEGYKNWILQTTQATFNEDGTYSGSGHFGNGTGTYKIKGSTITCYVSGEKFLVYKVITLDGNSATLSVTDPEDTDTLFIKCTKNNVQPTQN